MRVLPDWLRRRHREKFEAAPKFRDEVDDLRPGIALERFWVDVKYAVRTLGHRPLATGAAIVAFALGLGGATAVITMLANLSTAVYPQIRDPESLVLIVETAPADPAIANRQPTRPGVSGARRSSNTPRRCRSPRFQYASRCRGATCQSQSLCNRS
jgi:hypothetical protein